MTRLTLALLLALLATAPLAAVAGVGGAPPLASHESVTSPGSTAADRTGTDATMQSNNTTRRLGLDTVGRANYTTPGMDFASSVAVAGQQLDEGLRFEYLSVRTEQAGSAAQRRAIAEAEVARLNRSIVELRDREWSVLQAYGNGDISERELLHRLAVIHSEASQLEETINQLEDDGAEIDADRWVLRVEEYQTPLRARVLAALSDTADSSVHVHVSGSSQGVVLQSLSESRFSRDYYREAVRFDNYRTGPGDFSLNQFLDLINQRYPYVTAADDQRPPLEGTTEGIGIYEKSHDQGTIRLYNDGSTPAVYREYQSLRLSDLPIGRVHTVSQNGTTVTLHETPNGGPVKVTTTNALTDNPRVAQVYVDGERVGRTGSGGSLWIVQPSDGFVVTVRTAGGVINVSVPP